MVVSAFPPSSKGADPAIPGETLMASPEAAAPQDDADCPQDPPHHSSLLLDLYLDSSPKRPLKVRNKV